jgi:CheY-specific phosphatase CheX
MQPDTKQPAHVYTEAVVQTLIDTLDTMAFCPAEPQSADGVAPPDEAVLVSLRFSGARAGQIELVAGRAFARMLAASICGEDEADAEAGGAEQKAEDSIKEIVNVTAGAMMPRMASDDDVVNLALPVVRPFDTEAEWAAFVNSPGATALAADGGTLALRLVA